MTKPTKCHVLNTHWLILLLKMYQYSYAVENETVRREYRGNRGKTAV